MQQNTGGRPVQGLWFEDFRRDEVRTSAGRTITESDVLNFAGLTGDFSEVHTNREYMSRSSFGEPIAHGLLGLSVAQGLCWRSNYTDGTGIASLGWTEWMFHAPILIGDTLHTRWWLIEKRESKSRPDAGIITEHVELRNQRNETVQSGLHITMVKRKTHV
jgi:acyl dehydratase